MTTLTITNITDIDRFFEVVNKCKGKVELTTTEGDCLNLKSKLTQYFSLAKIFSDGNIKEMDLRIYEDEDMNLLLNYLVSR